MTVRRIAIELVFEDDLALLDYQEAGGLAKLLKQARAALRGFRVTVSPDPIVRNDRTGGWEPMGYAQPPRPSEAIMAALDRKAHPGKTSFDLARERLERDAR